MKDYEVECPKCGDFMDTRTRKPHHYESDFEFVKECGCADCLIMIEHKYPTDEYIAKVDKAIQDQWKRIKSNG